MCLKGCHQVARMWPGSALAAGEVTPASPNGKANTFEMNAPGACRTNGVTVTTTMSTMMRPTFFHAERPSRSRATNSAPAAMGHAVSFMAAARPN